MKTLPLHTPAYQLAQHSFSAWLDVQGYSADTVYALPVYVRSFLHWLETHHHTRLTTLTPHHFTTYYRDHLRHRPNRLGGALSNVHLNKHRQALYRFADWLRHSTRTELPPLHLPTEENDSPTPQVLTPQEIQQLYTAADNPPPQTAHKNSRLYPSLALRDKAMLTLYYSCALRRSEGSTLQLSDLYPEKHLLHIRKTKNRRERLVPLTAAALTHLEHYLYDARPQLQGAQRSEYFLLSERGQPIQNQTLRVRLRTLVLRTENPELIAKDPGLHTLRHSIATHLLTNGMPIEHIKDYLGHTSLESTQRYTHLVPIEH
ncbi:MAG: tyrosine-type recombinase/integrase [Bacteroidia bacterium]|jgi:integrase/recombinase XerD|nr:tyrosine-type recombinase/integrase [Bacteroidia bacterium]